MSNTNVSEYSPDILRALITPDDLRNLVAKRVKQCQARIQETFAEISHFHSLHNSVSRVCQLPFELLSIIFSYLQNGVGKNADLIAASHVCKHWRAVAIGNPCLWSSFAVHHPDGVQQMLMRSQSTLLSLSQTRFVCLTAAEHLNKAAHRIRCLHINMPIPREIAAVLYLLDAPAPNLAELHVKNTFVESPSSNDDDVTNAVHLLRPAFGGQVPSLRSLVLYDVSLGVVNPSSALVHLDIQVKLIDLPSLTTLLETFRTCPNLETVSLTGQCDEEAFVGVHSDTPKVPLHRLQSMDLTIYPQLSIINILTAIALPPQTKLCLVSPLDTIASGFHFLPDYSPTQASSLLCLEGLRRLEVTWSLVHAQIRADHHLEDTFQPPALDMRFVDSQELIVPHPGLLGSWRFDASRIEVLVLACAVFNMIENYVPGPISLWLNTLRNLPALRTLCAVTLHPHDTRHLLDALQSRSDGGDLLCPRLSALEFVNVALHTPNLQNKLCGVLLARSSEQDGVGLERVELSNCRFVLPVALRTTLEQRGVEIDMGED